MDQIKPEQINTFLLYYAELTEQLSAMHDDSEPYNATKNFLQQEREEVAYGICNCLASYATAISSATDIFPLPASAQPMTKPAGQQELSVSRSQ